MASKTIKLRDLIAAQRKMARALDTFQVHALSIGVVEHGYLFVEVDMSLFERAGMVEQVWAIKEAAETINAALHAHPELSWSADDGWKLTVDPGEGESWRLVQRPAPEAA